MKLSTILLKTPWGKLPHKHDRSARRKFSKDSLKGKNPILWRSLNFFPLRGTNFKALAKGTRKLKLVSSSDSLRPSRACTCVDLRSLVEIKFARKRTQVFTVSLPKPSQRTLNGVHYRTISQWITGYEWLDVCFCDLCILARNLVSLFGHPTATFYTSLTCLLLANPFGQGKRQQIISCSIFSAQNLMRMNILIGI